jgi:hypothetical protein
MIDGHDSLVPERLLVPVAYLVLVALESLRSKPVTYRYGREYLSGRCLGIWNLVVIEKREAKHYRSLKYET